MKLEGGAAFHGKRNGRRQAETGIKIKNLRR